MAAAPALDPPGVFDGSHGLRVMPVNGLSPTPLQPNSLVVDLPRITAPAARKRSTEGASRATGAAPVLRDPNRCGIPATAIRSLTEVGMPSSGPSNAPRIILLNDPTRGIDVGTKQEIYVLLRRLAEDGAAVLLYSTDYAELIGCCDRVAVFFDGRIVRWLAGDELTERALVASALNLTTTEAAAA